MKKILIFLKGLGLFGRTREVVVYYATGKIQQKENFKDGKRN